MKAVFMGTPDFAVPTLQKMVDMGIEITAVVTQPDKAKGRGKKVIYSPVKECALAHDLPVISRSASRRILNLFRHCEIWHRM